MHWEMTYICQICGHKQQGYVICSSCPSHGHADLEDCPVCARFKQIGIDVSTLTAHTRALLEAERKKNEVLTYRVNKFRFLLSMELDVNVRCKKERAYDRDAKKAGTYRE